MTDYAHGKKLDRLENTVVALKGEVQRLEDAHAELAATVSALTAVCASHFAALETPATPAPDPVCQYAGPNRKDRGGRTEGCISGCDWGLDDMFHHHPFCKGPSVPTAEPEPALDPVPKHHYYRMTEFGIVSRRVDEMADEACRCGQPFMDSLVRVLRERGANTVEESAEHLRLGMMSEAAKEANGRDGAR